MDGWTGMGSLQGTTIHFQATGVMRVSGNYQLYLEHCDVLRETVMDETLRLAKDLLNAVKKLQGQEAMQSGRNMSALKTL